jgi:hypothetical protein
MHGLTVQRLEHLGRDIAGLEPLHERVITAPEACCQKFYTARHVRQRNGGSE